LGQILGVRGSEASVALPTPALLEQSRATVGAFLRSDFDAGQGQERAFVKLVVERWRAASGGPRSIADEPTAAEMEAPAEPQPGPTHDHPEPEVPSRAPSTSASSRIEQIRAQMLRRGGTSNA
jgi:hypothetical protein